MNIDLVGRIRNTKLAARNGLMPLFEAIVNSIIAIQEAQRQDGRIEIQIEREPMLPAVDIHGNTIAQVESFVIEDNGAGFNKENFISFETMDSQAKAHIGGKGIGRILWLKAFDYVEIESTYSEDNDWFHRTFEFRETQDGIEKHSLRPCSIELQSSYPKTTVRLVSFKARYREISPKSTEAIARRIVEHCMEYFLLGSCPTITIDDPASNKRIELQDLFAEEYQPISGSREFQLGNDIFSITDVLLKATSEAQHRVHFCAHNRAVESLPLAGKVPHLDGPLTTQEGGSVVYSGYVTSRFLNERVDTERTGFNIDREEQLAFEGGSTWEELVSATVSAVSEYLEPLTAGLRERLLERVRTFVETKEPKYRPLLKSQKEEIEKLSGPFTDTALDLELHKILNNWRLEVRRDARERLDKVDTELSDFAAHREEYRRVLGEMQEISKSDLAEYVIHRATILSFFEKLLGRQQDDNFAREDALHGLFFPQRRTSDEIDYDDHSLWVIDERLAYHHFLASDIPLRKQNGPMEVDSDDRPDLLIYNNTIYDNPIAFSPGEEPFPSVVIVEFKRPERDDPGGEKSPISQVLRYVGLIREGRARRSDGSTIEPPMHMPFYCYVIATLKPSLKREAEERGFTQAPDGLGYFFYNSNFNAYIEISSYRKILDDAKKRNRALFDRLQITP